MVNKKRNLLEHIESISEQIQILALNIAVAAAKMSFNKKLEPDVNSKLSRLVNEATLTVKNMNMVIRAAKSDKPKYDILQESQNKVDPETIGGIENSLKAILDDSQKILSMLNEVRQKSL